MQNFLWGLVQREMEETKLRNSEQNVSDFHGENTLFVFDKSTAKSPLSVQKSGITGVQHLQNSIVSWTPEKTNETSHIKPTKEGVELPERYKIILELFDRMTCSLRLLNLRQKSPTFQNICRQVEILAGRKFSCTHLAQIKYILPEAVEIDKIHIHDEKTMCMKPDMKIALLFDVVEGHQEQSAFTALHKVFTSRLINFNATHPEGFDIPQSALPEPFNQRSITLTADSLPVGSSLDLCGSSTEIASLNSSHLSSSFSRRLSKKPVAETERTPHSASPVPLSSIKYDCKINQDIESGQQRTFPHSSIKSTVIVNPIQLTYPQRCVSSGSSKGTPLKLGLEGDNFMVETPAQMIPKRSAPNSDDKLRTLASHNRTTCNMTAKRSLDFSNSDGQENLLKCTVEEMEQHEVACDILSQMLDAEGILMEDNVCCSMETLQKETETTRFIAKDVGNNQNGFISQQQTSCLSDLVALIHHIFQSVNRTSITKEELVHKIIMNNCDIVESREVEKQIELLEKLVPDWICRKLVPSGDLLYSIKKVSDLSAVCERLMSV